MQTCIGMYIKRKARAKGAFSEAIEIIRTSSMQDAGFRTQLDLKDKGSVRTYAPVDYRYIGLGIVVVRKCCELWGSLMAGIL